MEDAFKNSEQAATGTHVVQRLTALWALSEAALGGVLHAFKIPLTGLFIGSSAVLIMTLMAYFSGKRGEILRATIIVMIVKGMVSPHAPIMSYAAVIVQGLLGEIIFSFVKPFRLAAFLLGFIALALSALQKFIVTTVVFGMNIWNSIDLFSNYIIAQFVPGSEGSLGLPVSLALIVGYSLIHIVAGIVVGFYGPRIAPRIPGSSNIDMKFVEYYNNFQDDKLPRKKRSFIRKISGYILFAIAIAIIILSYLYPVFEESQGAAALIMIVRSIVILATWYYIFAPLVIKYFRRFLSKKQNQYSEEVHGILDNLPFFKYMVRYSWEESKNLQFFKRVRKTIRTVLILSLTYKGN